MTEIPTSPSSSAGPSHGGETSGATSHAASAAAPLAAPADHQTAGRPRGGDIAIAVVLLVFFVAAYVFSKGWPFRAALFPQMISVLGAVLSALKLAGFALSAVRGRRAGTGVAVVPSTRAADLPEQPVNSSPESQNVRTAAEAGQDESAAEVGAVPDGFTIVDDEKEDDQSLEYVFATAGSRAWTSALGWIVTFFVGFFVIGAYITVPLFALVYLRIAGKASWVGAVIYAIVTGLIIFVVFREVVYIPLPESVFPFLRFG